MASVINTNIASLNAQRNLATSQSALQVSLQRLSSGMRINSAKDDSAGLAIASRMSAQIGGLQQASRNANDGISMAQTAEGSMGSIGDILLRMRDLAVQSANGSNSSADRTAIQNEVDQLYSEIDRISSTAEFNGVKLLNGTANSNAFQVGANANQTISFSISEVSTKSMQLNGAVALGDLNSGRVSGGAPGGNSTDLIINGKGVATATTDITAKLQAVAINAATGTTGVTATAYNSVSGTQGATGVMTGAMTIAVGAAAAVTVSASTSMSDLVDRINKEVGGITASIGTKGELVLSNDTGENIVIGGTVTGSGLTAGTYRGYLTLKSGDGGPITLTSTTAGGNALNLFGFNSSSSASNVTSKFQVGASNATAAGAVGTLTQTKLLITDDVKINGYSVGTTGSSAAEKAAAINAIHGQTGVTASASTTAYLTMDFSTGGTVTVNGSSIAVATTDDTAAVVTAINAANISGVTASTDATTGKLKLVSSSGTDLIIGDDAAANVITDVTSDTNVTATTLATNQFIAVRGQLNLSGDNGATVNISGTAASIAKLGLTEQGGATAVIGGKLSVSTAAQAQQAITSIDRAISYVNTQRSTMGAVQNRLTTSIANLASSVENISAARSRIQDTDFAAETATMTRNQILQQAGTAMLAQANSLPNSVLSLLK